ncbi:hypothetical protein OAK65_02680 [Synechococcus sp. AH-551-N17]|nr:hypothetical protein [Synechococcus sp. AH-551-N17]
MSVKGARVIKPAVETCLDQIPFGASEGLSCYLNAISQRYVSGVVPF